MPLAIAITVFAILTTWHKGQELVSANRSRTQGSLLDFLEELSGHDYSVSRVPGVGVFLNPNLLDTPPALRANVEHNSVVHYHVIIVAVEIERVPHVSDARRVRAERVMFSGATGDPLMLPAIITAVTLRFGFQDEPDVPSALRLAAEWDLIEGAPDFDKVTYFLSHTTIVPVKSPGMVAWRKKLFVTMARNASDPAEYFRLPDNQIVALGARIQL